jgi:phosphatidylinositol alpha-1,6-mannosyltransferase
MKIAIVGPEFPPTVGGEAEYAAQVALGLRDRGHQVVVFTRRGNIGRGQGYEVRDLLEGRQSCDREVLGSLREFDVVHVLNAAWTWVSALNRPTFLSIHGNDFIDPNPVYGYDLTKRLRLQKGHRIDFWLTVRRTRLMMRRCLPLCRMIFANSEYTKEAFLQIYPSCKGRVVKAGLGVGSMFIDGPISAHSRGSTAKLLTVCRLSEPRKNVDLVLRALSRLKSDFTFQYTIVGDGDLRPALLELSRELGLADRVCFVGRVAHEKLKSFYEQSDLFVLPSGVTESSFEGFGIVYLEANGLGVPTMAVRAAGAKEAVDEGRSGFFIEEPSVASIEQGLRSFLSGNREFSRADCRQFAAQFTWARVIDRFERAYNTI